MITAEKFYGLAKYATIPTSQNLTRNHRVFCIKPTNPNLLVRCPDARLLKTGFPVYVIFNTSSEHTLNITDNLDNVIETLDIHSGAELALIDNTTQAGFWIARQRKTKQLEWTQNYHATDVVTGYDQWNVYPLGSDKWAALRYDDGDDAYLYSSSGVATQLFETYPDDWYPWWRGIPTVSKVELFCKAKMMTVNTQLRPIIYTNGAAFGTTKTIVRGRYIYVYQAWYDNPATSTAWTKTDLDALRIGLVRYATGGDLRVTRLYFTATWMYPAQITQVPTLRALVPLVYDLEPVPAVLNCTVPDDHTLGVT